MAVSPGGQVQHAADRLELLGQRLAVLRRGPEGARRDGPGLALGQSRLALEQGDDRVVVPPAGDEVAGGAQGFMPAMDHKLLQSM